MDKKKSYTKVIPMARFVRWRDAAAVTGRGASARRSPRGARVRRPHRSDDLRRGGEARHAEIAAIFVVEDD